MNRKATLTASGAMLLLAFGSATAMADDVDLEVTMEVIDSLGEIDGPLVLAPPPAQDVPEDAAADEEDGDEDFHFDQEGGTSQVDDFTVNAEFDTGAPDSFEFESDFEQGEQLDLDIAEDPMP